LASSSGSVENLNVSVRHGLIPYFLHARATVASPTPSWLASSRVDQCVTANVAGGGSSVAARIAASSTVFGRPERGSSSRPAIPDSANRSRHLITVGRDSPSWPATAVVPAPAAEANTIRARSTCPADTVEERVHDSRISRSASVISTVDDGMPHHPTPSTN
jgi:hypothetical protein